MLRYSPIALVLVLIAIAVAWDAQQPEDDPHAAQPLRGEYEDRPRAPQQAAHDEILELPVYDPVIDDPDYHERNDGYETELADEIARDLAGGAANLDEDQIIDVLTQELPGADDPSITSRRLLATLNRRRQQLDLVQRLLDQVLPEIEAAQQSGDDERAEWLEETRGRLETRRDSIVESIVEMAETDNEVLASNDELREAIEEIRGYQPSEEQ